MPDTTAAPNEDVLEAPEIMRRLKSLAKHLNISDEELYKKIVCRGLSQNKYITGIKHPHTCKLNYDERVALVKFLNDNDFMTNTASIIKTLDFFPDYMYFSLIRYLKYSSDTEKETHDLLPGLYILYRPSLKIPDMFTIGLMHITINEKTNALCVEEIHKFKGSDEFEKGSVANEGPIDERFHGYLIRKRRRYICFQRNQNPKNANFIVTMFNNEFLTSEEAPKIASLGGVCFGTSGSIMYISRVFIERCTSTTDRDQLIDNLNYVKEKDIKPSVIRNLKLPSGEYFHVF